MVGRSRRRLRLGCPGTGSRSGTSETAAGDVEVDAARRKVVAEPGEPGRRDAHQVRDQERAGERSGRPRELRRRRRRRCLGREAEGKPAQVPDVGGCRGPPGLQHGDFLLCLGLGDPANLMTPCSESAVIPRSWTPGTPSCSGTRRTLNLDLLHPGDPPGLQYLFAPPLPHLTPPPQFLHNPRVPRTTDPVSSSTPATPHWSHNPLVELWTCLFSSHPLLAWDLVTCSQDGVHGSPDVGTSGHCR